MAKNMEPRRNNSNATTLNESSLDLNKSMEEDEEQLDDDNELDQQAQRSSKVSAKKRMPTINQNVRVNNKNLYRMVLSLC
jgi:uncharacterized protein (DUF342 family)